MTIDLIHGECLEEMAKLPDQSVDAIITDPPYGTTNCSWDVVIPFPEMWEQLKRIIKPRGAIVLFGSQPFTSALIMSNVKMFREEVVWLKSNGGTFLNANRKHLKRHESIVLFADGQNIYNPQMTWGEPYRATSSAAGETTQDQTVAGWETINDGSRYPVSYIYKSSQTGHHPTQKPVKLMEYLIKTYTLEGETVLDFTMGSGSTGVAAKNTGRRFIGIEQDEGYYETAQKRIAAAVRQLEMF
jgi:site-specific DNA-methyltransferase (adenine-specific)